MKLSNLLQSGDYKIWKNEQKAYFVCTISDNVLELKDDIKKNHALWADESD